VRYLFTCSSAISETISVAVFYVSSPFRRAHGASCSGPVCEDVFGIWLDSYSNFHVECEVVHWQGQAKLQVKYLRAAGRRGEGGEVNNKVARGLERGNKGTKLSTQP
jgi:hypothetical protein